MYKFLPIKFDPVKKEFKNRCLVLPVLCLLEEFKENLFDDYMDNSFIELINRVFPHFYACVDENNNFIGFVYLDEWRGNKEKLHSCTLSMCAKKEFWGSKARDAGKFFINHIFETYKIHKLKAEVFSFNKPVMHYLNSIGFKRESVLKQESFKNSKPVDIVVFTKIKGE